ncbi:hypothetical protein CBS101457_001344 [Exobasidium rhododendri]|nr:hypothetical protein CBS101457_001344 [Exobasidium rhododendri]
MKEAELLAVRRSVALQYFAQIAPKTASFQWPSPLELLEIQDFLLDDLALEQSQSKEGSVGYEKVFLKESIARLEAAVESGGNEEALIVHLFKQEVSGDILEAYALLMAKSVNDLAPPPRTITYYYPSSKPSDQRTDDGLFAQYARVRIREESSLISRGTTGLKTCIRLAAHLLSVPEVLAQPGLRILELGSGSGLLGAILAKEAGRGQVFLTDREGVVLDRLVETIQENFSEPTHVHISALDWLDVADQSSASFQHLCSIRPQLILAADVVYDPDLFDALCQVLYVALKPAKDDDDHDKPKPFALIASTMRNGDTYSLFLQAIGRSGLSAREETLITPTVDLHSGTIVKEGSTFDLPLFPTNHVAQQDGFVKLIRVTA